MRINSYELILNDLEQRERFAHAAAMIRPIVTKYQPLAFLFLPSHSYGLPLISERMLQRVRAGWDTSLVHFFCGLQFQTLVSQGRARVSIKLAEESLDTCQTAARL